MASVTGPFPLFLVCFHANACWGNPERNHFMKHVSKKFFVLALAVPALLASCGGVHGNAIDAKCDALPEGAYVYRGQQSAKKVNFYSAVMYTLRDQAREFIGKKAFGITKGMTEDQVLAKLHEGEAVWGHMSSTSSAGTVYPTYYLYQHGYTLGFKTREEYNKLSADDKKKAVIGINQAQYPDGVDMLMTGTIDVSCGFMDTRYGSAFVQKDGKYEGNENLFANTYTVGITDPIMNDTISVRAALSDAKREAIWTAFSKATTDGDIKTEDTGAWLLYQIYSHTGYAKTTDAAYKAAKDMYVWQQKQNGKDITINENPTYPEKETADSSNEIKIKLVPSNDAQTLESRAKKLEPILNRLGGGEFSFKIDVGTKEGGYEAVTSALAANQIDAAFLPAGSYAQACALNEGKVQVFMAATRAGYKVQAEDFAGKTETSMFDDEHKELQRKAMNGEVKLDGTAC